MVRPSRHFRLSKNTCARRIYVRNAFASFFVGFREKKKSLPAENVESVIDPLKLYQILRKKQRRCYTIKRPSVSVFFFSNLLYTMGIFAPAVKAEPPHVQRQRPSVVNDSDSVDLWPHDLLHLQADGLQRRSTPALTETNLRLYVIREEFFLVWGEMFERTALLKTNKSWASRHLSWVGASPGQRL